MEDLSNIDSYKDSRNKYVTVSDAARHLRVCRNTIYDACRKNEIKYLKVRSTVRVLIDKQEQYLTVAEAARYLSVSPSTIYESCSQETKIGQLPHIRICSSIRIPAGELQRFIGKEFSQTIRDIK